MFCPVCREECSFRGRVSNILLSAYQVEKSINRCFPPRPICVSSATSLPSPKKSTSGGRATPPVDDAAAVCPQAIRALEDTLGVELFARTRRSAELTAVGRRSAAGSTAAAGQRRRAAGHSRRASRAARRGAVAKLRVDRGLPGCCRCCCAIFGARYPRVRLQLAEATSDVQIEELVAGRIDAGLVIAPLPPRHRAQLSYLPIAREPLVIAMSSELAARVGAARIDATDATADASTDATRDAGARRMHDIPVSLRDVADAPLVIFPRRLAPGFYDIILDCYGVAGLTPRIGQEGHPDADDRQPRVGRHGCRAGAAIGCGNLAAYRRRLPAVARIGAGDRNRSCVAHSRSQPGPGRLIDIVRTHASPLEPLPLPTNHR